MNLLDCYTAYIAKVIVPGTSTIASSNGGAVDGSIVNDGCIISDCMRSIIDDLAEHDTKQGRPVMAAAYHLSISDAHVRVGN